MMWDEMGDRVYDVDELNDVDDMDDVCRLLHLSGQCG